MILPKNTILGDLRLEEVYHFYDIPRLFSCFGKINDTGEEIRYLALSVFEDDMISKFLYLPLSDKRFDALKKHHTTLAWAFLNPEIGDLYMVESDYDGNASVDKIKPIELTAKDLPEKYVYFDSPYAYP